MSKEVRALWWVILAAFLLMAPLAFSQTVDLTLNDGGGNIMNGVYVGPYNATQSINNQNPQNVQIICDDFSHEVVPGESWQATVTSVSSLSQSNVGNLMWGTGTLLSGGTGAANVLQGYLAMAYLASEILPLSGNPANNQMVGYYAYAIWAIFQGSQVEAWLGGANSAAWKTVYGYAMQALSMTNLTPSQFAGWELLTPVPGSQPMGNGLPQEYFEFVPEGGTALMYLLLAGFACFGTMYFKSRRRQASSWL